MQKIVENLNTIAKEQSKNSKVDLLKTYLEDEEFALVVEMALDETLHYNMKKLIAGAPVKDNPTFDDLMDYLYFLTTKQGATSAEKKELSSFAINEYWEDIILRIINKDLRCGIGAKLINKAAPGSILLVPYLQCSTSNKKKNIVYPAYAQVKEDGLFANIFVNENEVKYLSRNGNEFIFPEDSLTNDIKKYYPKHKQTKIYMGEFRIRINGKYLDRKTSNGIVNKALKKNQTMSTGESLKVHFICWDVVTDREFWETKSPISYYERFENLNFLENCESKRNHLSKTIVVDNFKQAQEWAIELINSGEEGCIIKNFHAKWSYTKSSEQIKLKAGDIGAENEMECELKVIGWYHGKVNTKFETCLGGLICESGDQLLEVNIGGGYSERDRGFLGWSENHVPIIINNFEEWVEEEYMDEIITVKFNEVIKAKTSKKHSLFSPRFIEKRNDKDIADTLNYIKELGYDNRD